MQSHMNDSTKRDKKNKSYEDNGELKNYIDETFLLNYLVSDTIDKTDDEDDTDKEKVKELTDKLIDKVILKVVELNPYMTKDEVENLIGEKFAIIKYKHTVSDADIVKDYKEAINKYIDKINDFKF